VPVPAILQAPDSEETVLKVAPLEEFPAVQSTLSAELAAPTTAEELARTPPSSTRQAVALRPRKNAVEQHDVGVDFGHGCVHGLAVP